MDLLCSYIELYLVLFCDCELHMLIGFKKFIFWGFFNLYSHAWKVLNI